MQRVLIIGKVWPEPGSSAAGSRMMQLIEVFQAQSWKINFACASGESEFMPNMEEMQIETFKVKINDSSFDELLKTIHPHLVLFDRFTTEEQFGWRVKENVPQAIRVLDTIDLHSLRTERRLAIKESRKFEWRDLLRSEVAMREIASIYRCDSSLIISMPEM